MNVSRSSRLGGVPQLRTERGAVLGVTGEERGGGVLAVRSTTSDKARDFKDKPRDGSNKGHPLVWTLVAIVAIFWPEPAFAWGPTAHLDFGLQMVRGAFTIAPAIRALVEAYPKDYLYGCLAADIIVGKNRANYDLHCHNWKNGLRLLSVARTDPHRALGYGFLSHLAADTVAHNYFVPYKLVESYYRRATRHTYWELRYEHVIHHDEQVWQKFREIQGGHFPGHDGFLDAALPGASQLFSFRNSRRIFRSAMAVMRTEGFRGIIRNMATRSLLPLSPEEAAEYRSLALDAIASLLWDENHAPVLRVDPTGARCLRAARHARLTLRRMRAERRLDPNRLHEFLPQLRAQFRASLSGSFHLPDVEDAVRVIRRTRSYAKVRTHA